MVSDAAQKREALATWAELQHSDGVAEDPPGSNDGEPMRRFALPRETPLAWCARMVRTGLLVVEAFPVPLTPAEVYAMASAEYLLGWIEGHALAPELCHVAPGDVQRGDLCFLATRGASDPLHGPPRGHVHHVSIVVRATPGVGEIVTVDGNWSDRVCVQPRGRNDLDIFCFVRFPRDVGGVGGA